MESMTKRQREVHSFIGDYISRKGYPPTHEEIRQGLEMSTKSLVNHHLKALENKGLIEREPDTPRGIKLLNIRSFKVPLMGQIAASAEITAGSRLMSACESNIRVLKPKKP